MSSTRVLAWLFLSAETVAFGHEFLLACAQCLVFVLRWVQRKEARISFLDTHFECADPVPGYLVFRWCS